MKIGKILVIDDNKDHRNAIQYLSKKEGYIVLNAQNGEIGLDLLNEHEDIQVVIIDLAMLVVSGVEVLKEIKDWPHPLRRIVLTAYDEELPFKKAEELKVFSYLNKPISKNTLLFTVKSAFNDLNIEETKQWVDLEQVISDFVNNEGKKSDHILSEIDLIKKELQNLNTLIKSGFKEIMGNLNQKLTVSGEMNEKHKSSGKPKGFMGSSSD